MSDEIKSYDQLKADLRSFGRSAHNLIPRMCVALRKENENMTNEDIKDRVTKDCLEAGFAKQTIIHNIPEEFKKKEKVDTGKQRGKIKKEILSLVDGSELPNKDSAAKIDAEKLNTSSVANLQHNSQENPEKVVKFIQEPEPESSKIEKIDSDNKDGKIAELQYKLDQSNEARKELMNQIEKLKKEKQIVEKVESTGFVSSSSIEFPKEDANEVKYIIKHGLLFGQIVQLLSSFVSLEKNTKKLNIWVEKI